VQFPQFVPGTAKARLITIGTGWLGFAPGCQITLAVRPGTGTAEISGAGDKPLVSSATFALSADSSPINSGTPEHFYFTGRLPLNGTTAQAASFEYLNPSTPQLPVQILGPGGAVARILVPSHK
jgi:hypothetical protein